MVRTGRWMVVVLVCLCAPMFVACGDDDNHSGFDAGVDGAVGDDAQVDGGVGPDVDPLARFDEVDLALQNEMFTYDVRGFAVAIIEGGEVTFAKGYGYKDAANTDAVEPTTLFRISSVTKGLTAIGLLQLVESGDVDLAAPVTDYVPGFHFTQDASWAPGITVGDLLKHTSAMNNRMDVSQQPTNDDALAEFFTLDYPNTGRVMAPAGRMYNYTNTGFDLAGLVIEEVSGSYYRQYMQDHVFDPLGMQRTYFLPAEAQADGDYADGSCFTCDCGWTRPAVGAFSSVLDLAEYVKFLRAGDPLVLADSWRLAMQQPQVDTDHRVDFEHYGYGLRIDLGVFFTPVVYRDVNVIWHQGAFSEYHAEFDYFPELDFGFVWVATCRTAGCGANPWQTLLTALETLTTLPEPTPGPDLSVHPSQFDRLVGEYYEPFVVGTISATRVGDDLLINMPTLDSSMIQYDPILTPIFPQVFIATIDGAAQYMTFILDGNGDGEYIRADNFVARRINSLRAGSRVPSHPPLYGPSRPVHILSKNPAPAWRYRR